MYYSRHITFAKCIFLYVYMSLRERRSMREIPAERRSMRETPAGKRSMRENYNVDVSVR